MPKLTTKQQLALQAILDRPYGTIQAIAIEAGVDRHTVSQWKKLPYFADELQRQRELWNADLREERLASKRERLRTLGESLERLEEKVPAVYEFGEVKDWVGLEGGIESKVKAAAAEMPKDDFPVAVVYPEDDPRHATKVGDWMHRFARKLSSMGMAGAPEEVTAYQMADWLIEYGRKAEDSAQSQHGQQA